MLAPVIAGVASGIILLRVRPERLTGPGLGALVLFGAAIGGMFAFLAWFVPKQLFATSTGGVHSIFGMAHLVYVVALGVPVAVALVAVIARVSGVVRSMSGAAVALAVGSGGLAVLGLVSTHVTPFMLHVDRVSMPVPERVAGSGSVRIGVISDIQTTHVGRYEREAVARLMALKPDVILIPGDLLQVDPSRLQAEVAGMRDLLGGLHAPGGVFVVDGNVDSPEGIRSMIVGTDVTFVDRELVTTRVGERSITIAGTFTEDVVGVRSPDAAVVAELAGSDPNAFRILLAHRPDDLLFVKQPADLVVSGHTHGGQIAVPGLGPLVDLSALPNSVTRGGLSEFEGTPVYVSTGVGVERGEAPQVRLGVRPSIGLITVTG